MTRQLTGHLAHWAEGRLELVAVVATAVIVVVAMAAILVPAFGAAAPATDTDQVAGTRAGTPAIAEPCLSPRGVFCAGPLLSARNHHRAVSTPKVLGSRLASRHLAPIP